MTQLSPELNAQFMERFCIIENMSVEEAGQTYMNTISPYQVTPTGRHSQDAGTSVASCKVGDLQLVSSHWGSSMRGTPLVDDGPLSIGFPISGSSELIDPFFGTIKPKPHEARVFRQGGGTCVIGNGARTVLDLVIPYRLIEDRARSHYGNQLNGPLRFSPLLDLNSPAGLAVVRLVEYLRYYVLNVVGLQNKALVTTHLQELVISNIFGLLSHSYEPAEDQTSDCALPNSVRLAEDFMRAYADQPITLEVLARHAGCSERSLQIAFKKYRQKSPLGVLRDIRLEKAHSDLKCGEATVTDIVYKWGFTSAGRFSKVYAQKFGCKPSETLRYHAS